MASRAGQGRAGAPPRKEKHGGRACWRRPSRPRGGASGGVCAGAALRSRGRGVTRKRRGGRAEVRCRRCRNCVPTGRAGCAIARRVRPERAAKRQEEQAQRIAWLRAELARDRVAAREHQAAPPDPDRQARDYWRDPAPGVSSPASTAPLAVRGDARLAAFCAMDPQALREAAAADQVGSVWSGRAMTVEDAARLVSPAYAAAAEQVAQL